MGHMSKRDEATLLRLMDEVNEALAPFLNVAVTDGSLLDIQHIVDGIIRSFTEQGFLPIKELREDGHWALARFETGRPSPIKDPGRVAVRAIWKRVEIDV